eukprot:2051558-Prymnesium_polylepis.1
MLHVRPPHCGAQSVASRRAVWHAPRTPPPTAAHTITTPWPLTPHSKFRVRPCPRRLCGCLHDQCVQPLL